MTALTAMHEPVQEPGLEAGPLIGRKTEPLVNAIQRMTGVDRPEAIRRAGAYVEALWDNGIVLMSASEYIAGRLRLRTVIAFLVFLAGMVAGNLDPIDLTPAT